MPRPEFLPVLLAILLAACAVPAPDPVPTEQPDDLVGPYLDRYFETFPSRATGEGLHDHDDRLEDLSSEARTDWIAFNRDALEAVRERLAGEVSEDERLDLERVARQAELTLYRWEVLEEPATDPLFWSGIASNATAMLLVREDRPLEERLAAIASRMEALPRLAEQARRALEGTATDRIAPELARMASGQVGSAARFYREGISRVAEEASAETRARLEAAAGPAASALEELSGFFADLASTATGSARAGEAYPRLFALYTGLEETPERILARAEADLAAKRREAAEYGRSVWSELMGDVAAPADDTELLRGLFRRIEEDHAESVEDFVADYRALSDASIAFVREHDVVTIPEPLEIWIGTSPDYFMGQSVGGVYPPGPWSPEAETLLFLPTPPSDATPEQRERLFRAFNHHFNVMITPHELVPGHTLQLASAARHPRPVRAVFADAVYVEGWGTFAERLMLDLGWGEPADRIAHLKKQLENIARTIVDIRVHTTDTSEEETLAFVRDEALQDEQFAGNMWMRALTSSPQLTTYYLGYRQVTDLFEDVKAARGETFVLKQFMDGMMELGPVPVREYRARMLGGGSSS